MSNPEKYSVFSYGILKRGFPNHQLMEEIQAEFISTAETLHTYPLIISGKWNTPFMLDHIGCFGSHRVVGELYQIDSKGLEVLDEFEGVNRAYYKRCFIDVSCHDAEGNVTSIGAWCYFRSETPKELITDASRFLRSYGRERIKNYIPVNQRPKDWSQKR